MRKLVVLSTACILSKTAAACTSCNNEVRAAIFNGDFYPNLFIMLSAFLVTALIVAVLAAITTKAHQKRVAANPGMQVLTIVPLTSAAMVLGIGLGGFIDGIVLHQILQWHEMISNILPPTTYVAKSVNMFWDGVFHAFTLLVVIVGIILMWRLMFRKDVDRSEKLLAGGLLLGWGIFNIVEGVIDHQLLKLHNVREISSNKEAWNIGFLAVSVVLIIAGWLLVRARVVTVAQGAKPVER